MFPFAGVQRGVGYQQQPPYTTLDALNTRPRDTFDRRQRGGSRPGLTKGYLTELGYYSGSSSGTATDATPSVFDDSGVDWRLYASIGDTVIITAGTNVTPGSYTVSAVATDGTTISLSTNPTSGGAGSAITYTIRRANQDINLLTSVRPVETALANTFTENFQTTSEIALQAIDGWSQPSWSGQTANVRVAVSRLYPDELKSVAFVTPLYTTPTDTTPSEVNAAALHTALTRHDTTQGYTIELKCRRQYDTTTRGAAGETGRLDGGVGHYGKWRVFVCMDNSNPDPAVDGVTAEIWANVNSNGLQFDLVLNRYESSSLTATTALVTASPVPQQEFIMRVRVNPGSKTVSLELNNQSADAISTTFSGSVPGHRWGVGLGNNVANIGAGQSSRYPIIERMGVFYAVSSVGDTRQRKLIAGCDGNLWVENAAGGMTQITTHTPNANMRIRDDTLLVGAERGGKLYIADYGPRVSGTASGTATNATPSVFDDAGVSDWVTAGVSVGDIVTITGGTNVTAGQYIVSVVAAGSISLSTNPCSGGAGSSITYTIQRGPKILDLESSTLSCMTATTGTLPTGCNIAVLWNDRLVFAGDFNNPQVWYMARQGTPTDFNYSGTIGDPQQAIAGSATEAGIIGDAITAVVPSVYDYLIFFCENSSWVLRGDPGSGGRFDNLSQRIGCISRAAWTHGRSGEVYFLSRAGLYMIPPGGGALPSDPISKSRLPKELVEVNTQTTRVLLQYDQLRDGVHIFLTPESGGSSGTHWYFDLETQSFWPERYPETMQARSVHAHYLPGSEDRLALFGGRDGYIRRMNDDFGSDDGTAIDSFVWIGPIALGDQPNAEGIVMEIVGILSELSSDLTWEIFVGDSPENAFRASSSHTSGTFEPGVNYRHHPRARGVAAFIKLSNDENNARWAMEQIDIVRRAVGRLMKV